MQGGKRIRFTGESLTDALAAVCADLTLAQCRLRNLARSDPATGLLSRGAFDARLADELKRSARCHRRLTLAVFVLAPPADGGNAACDRRLRAFATICAAHARAGDSLARTGTHEVALVMPRMPLEEGLHLAERIASVARRDGVAVTISVGAADAAAVASPSELVRAARIAATRPTGATERFGCGSPPL